MGLLAVAALLLTFTRPASMPKRLLALLLGVTAATQGSALIRASDIPSALLVADHYWFDVHVLRYGAWIAFFAFYPTRAALRSWHGALLVAAAVAWAAAAGVFVLAKDLAFLDPAGPWDTDANRTPLFNALRDLMVVSSAAVLLAGVARAAVLPGGPRRSAAFILVASIGAFWLGQGGRLLVEAGAAVASGASPVVAVVTAPAGAGSGPAVLPMYLVFGGVALGMAARYHSIVWLGFLGYGALRFLLQGVPGASLNTFSLYYGFAAIGLLHVVRRFGEFETNLDVAWQRALADLTVFLTVLLAALSVGLGVFGEAALPLAGSIVAAMLLAGAAVLASDPGLAPGLLPAPVTAGRLGAYRAALEVELAAGGAEGASRKLAGLRAGLGVSEHEHEVMAYMLLSASHPGLGEDALRPGALFLGRYRVQRGLDGGGRGATFLCRDERVGREVVLKRLRAPVPTKAGLEQLLREARAIGALRHPNVVTLYDVEQVGDEAFVVMEHVPGGSLAGRLAEGPLHPEAFAAVAGGLLAALQAVHERGIVHRDVKPSNVLLTERGEPKLGDFGVAHIPGFEATVGPGDGAAVGTVRYMSPEQARGHEATARSDLFGAAATLFEAWTGQPYLAPRAGESSAELQMRAARAGPFARRVPGPPAMQAWFARALHPRPEERFASAAEMAAALERTLGRGFSPGPGTAGNGPRRSRRPPGGRGAAPSAAGPS